MDSKRNLEILAFDPFAGDFGDQGDRTLSDKMVRAAKPHSCFHCKGPIVVGEAHRSRSDITDGDLMSFRWCAACCMAMTADDSVSAYDARFREK